jgi:hypothetical protein
MVSQPDKVAAFIIKAAQQVPGGPRSVAAEK